MDDLKNVPARYLVEELMDRGILRRYGVTKYLPPNVVRKFLEDCAERGFPAEESARRFEEISRGALLQEFLQYIVAHNTVCLEDRRLADNNPDAHPNARQLEATIVTLDPQADFDDKTN